MTLQEIQYKAQAIMHKWRDEDSAPYVEFVEELASMDVPELPEGLEEAACEYVEELEKKMEAETGSSFDEDVAYLLTRLYIAGAELQKKRDDLALTWENIRLICEIDEDMRCHSDWPLRGQEVYYEEVLRRFREMKDK